MPSFVLEKIGIPLSDIHRGKTDFSFVVKPVSKELDENRVVIDQIEVKAEATPLDKDVLIKLSVTTEALFYCDRCTEPFKNEIHGNVHTLFTSDPSELEGDDGEVRLLETNSSELDLTREVEDLLILAVPDKVICQETCQGLCPQCGSNLNNATCSCNHDQIDPRWDALKNLNLND